MRSALTTNPKGYNLLHKWVRRYRPKPLVCETCHQNVPTDLANISGQYKRTLVDWKWLCRSCHRIMDEAIAEQNRQCSICGTDKTYTKKYNGRPLWQFVDGKVVCHTCYCRNYYYTEKAAAESATS